MTPAFPTRRSSDLVFEEGTDIYFARQLVNERIQLARENLPPNIQPIMGPTSTGLGEIYMWTVVAKEGALKPDGTPYSPMDLREIRSEEHTSELQSLMRISYAVFCLKKKKNQ